jgi:hypothetical protein
MVTLKLFNSETDDQCVIFVSLGFRTRTRTLRSCWLLQRNWPRPGSAMPRISTGILHTDKKENQIFLIYKEIQSGAVAKSYMTNGLLIYGEIFAHFLIYWKLFLVYDFATAPL